MTHVALYIGVLDAVIAVLLLARGIAAIAGGRPCGAERVLSGLAIASVLLVFTEYATAASGEAGRTWFGTPTSLGGRVDVGISLLSGLVASSVWVVLELAERLGTSRRRAFRWARWPVGGAAIAAVAMHLTLVVGCGEFLGVQEGLRSPMRPVASPPLPASIPLQVIGGYPAIQLRLDGHPLDLIVDTGSEGTILSSPAAEAALQHGSPLLWTRVFPLYFSFPLYGRTVQARVHRVERLELGGYRFERLYVPSADFRDFLGLEAEFHGFAGMDLLGAFVATFDFQRMELVLARPPGAEPPPRATVLPAEVVGGRLFVGLWLSASGHEVSGRHRFLLDTGVPHTILDLGLGVPEGIGAARLHFDAERSWSIAKRYRIRDLGDVDGILGNDLLRAYRVTLDPAGRRVWLVPYDRQ